MVRSIIIIATVLVIILGGSYFESKYINAKIEELEQNLAEVIESTREQEDNSQKLTEIHERWKKTKHVLHAFIPHNDIREVDGLIVQSNVLIQKGEYVLALTQLKKLNDMIKGIPEHYHFSFGNIF